MYIVDVPKLFKNEGTECLDKEGLHVDVNYFFLKFTKLMIDNRRPNTCKTIIFCGI